MRRGRRGGGREGSHKVKELQHSDEVSTDINCQSPTQRGDVSSFSQSDRFFFIISPCLFVFLFFFFSLHPDESFSNGGALILAAARFSLRVPAGQGSRCHGNSHRQITIIWPFRPECSDLLSCPVGHSGGR